MTEQQPAGNGRNGNPGTAGVYLENASNNVVTRVLAANNVPYGVLAYRDGEPAAVPARTRFGPAVLVQVSRSAHFVQALHRVE